MIFPAALRQPGAGFLPSFLPLSLSFLPCLFLSIFFFFNVDHFLVFTEFVTVLFLFFYVLVFGTRGI